VVKQSAIEPRRLSEHVVQFKVPTPTLPPEFETNSYLIHDQNQGVIVDAGTRDEALLNQLIDLIQGHGVTEVKALIATHYHRDHTQGLPYLQYKLDAPIWVHAIDLPMARQEMLQTNPPNLRVAPMQSNLLLKDLSIEVIHAPGHTHGHVHITVPRDGVVLVGDHLSGSGTVWIGPPDGHMADYYQTLDRLAEDSYLMAGPGHGDAIPKVRKAALEMKHRRQRREQDIVSLVTGQSYTLQQITHQLYDGAVPEEAMWVARKTVQAHLQYLLDQSRISRDFDGERSVFVYTSIKH
jgi:ribonuclease/clavin/mitogillin